MRSFNLISSILCLSLASCVWATEDSLALIYQEDLSDGYDKAVVEAFNKAKLSVNPLTNVDLKLEEIIDSLSSLRVVGDKLEISFNEANIKEILNSEGAISNTAFKPILMWLCDTDSERATPVSSDTPNPFVQKIVELGSQGQMPIMLPLMDLDDLQAVNVNTVFNHEDEKLALASKRYGDNFFIAGGMQTQENGDIAVKWNVYDIKGQSLASGDISAPLDEAALTMLMQVKKTLSDNITQETPKASEENFFELGQGDGFVRVMICNIKNLSDYRAIENLFVTYGYMENTPIVARNDKGIIYEIKTGSNASILDGTFAHAPEFKKISDWTYEYQKSKGFVEGNLAEIGKASDNLILSSFIVESNIGEQETLKKTLK